MSSQALAAHGLRGWHGADTQAFRRMADRKNVEQAGDAVTQIESRELIIVTPEPGFASWTNWARDLGTSLPTPSRMLQFQSDFALREGS